MKKVVLEVESRQAAGKGAARRLRAQGKVPAVIYGHGQETVSVSVDAARFNEVQAGSHAVITLKEVSGAGKWDAIIKSVALGKMRRNLLHVDFQRVLMNEKIKASVLLRFEGEPRGVKDGGVLQHIIWDLEVQALPGDLPDALTADISSLGVGESLSLGDLELPPGVEVVLPPETAVVSVVAPRSAVEEEAPEAAVETAEEQAERDAEPAEDGEA
jgi:large subunit ribosomal protein L25